MGHHSEIETESPCEKENKKYCLNGGKCYYLDEEDIVGCNCLWFYGGKLCEKYVVDLGKLFPFKICRVVKILIQNLTRCEKIDAKSDQTKTF